MDVKKFALVMIHTPCLCGSESDREDLFVYVCVCVCVCVTYSDGDFCVFILMESYCIMCIIVGLSGVALEAAGHV